MPLTVWAFEAGVETYGAYAVRCLWWAARTYLDEGIYPTRAQLLNRARKNHADTTQHPIVRQTVDAILAMIDATGGTHLRPHLDSLSTSMITISSKE